jgi:hypothetical protein
MAANDDERISASEARKGRRFTVLWSAAGREKRSAQMTEPEAQKFVDKLRLEKADAVRIDEMEMPKARAAR